MKTRPVFPLLVSMALPNVISMLVNSLYNIVDSLFVAQINEQAMTALSLVFPIQNFVNAVAIGFGIGINALVALYRGAGDHDRADAAATHGMALSVLHGLLCTLLATIALNALWALCTSRACFALWASGTRSACGALRALLTLRADRTDGAGVALVAFLAFEVTTCDAVLQLLQTASGFLSALAGIARTGGGFAGGGLGGFCRGFHLLESLVPGCVHSLRGGGLLVTDGFQCVLFGGDGVSQSLSGLLGRCPGLLRCRLCISLGLLCGGGIGVHGTHQLLPCRGARFRLCAILCARVGTHTIPQVCAGHHLCAARHPGRLVLPLCVQRRLRHRH